jgi:hypothetical protein
MGADHEWDRLSVSEYSAQNLSQGERQHMAPRYTPSCSHCATPSQQWPYRQTSKYSTQAKSTPYCLEAWSIMSFASFFVQRSYLFTHRELAQNCPSNHNTHDDPQREADIWPPILSRSWRSSEPCSIPSTRGTIQTGASLQRQ